MATRHLVVRCDNHAECGRFTWSETGLCEGCRPDDHGNGSTRQAENAVIRAGAVEAGIRLKEWITADRKKRGIPECGTMPGPMPNAWKPKPKPEPEPEPRCAECGGGGVRADNAIGICQRNLKCKAEYQRRKRAAS